MYNNRNVSFNKKKNIQGKNDFAERAKILLDTDLKIILMEF